MDERLRFAARLLAGEKMAAMRREFDISRKTGYKIFNRYKDCGLDGLTDRPAALPTGKPPTRSGQDSDRPAEEGEAELGSTQDPGAVEAASPRRPYTGDQHRSCRVGSPRAGQTPQEAPVQGSGHRSRVGTDPDH